MTQLLLGCSCGPNGFVLTYWTQDSLTTWRAMPATKNLTKDSGLVKSLILEKCLPLLE